MSEPALGVPTSDSSAEPGAPATQRPTDTPAAPPAAQAPPFDLHGLIERRQGEQMDLLRNHVNPKFAGVLKTIGFDRRYVRGKGQYLWDSDGRRYLDMLSGYGMFNLGRHHPVIQQAIRDYLDLDEPTKPQMGPVLLSGLLAEKLKQTASWADKVFFTNSGTEAIEAALKFTRAATKRERVIYCDRAFHGLTYGALSLNGCASFRDGFVSMLPGPVPVPFGDLDALERELRVEKTAAFVVEPVQGKGVYPASPEYLLGAQELCRKHGAKLVIDEVQTGMGRTGSLWAIDRVPGLSPDVMTVSKSLSGGYVPIGAVLMKQAVFDGVFTSLDRAVVHSSTFGQMGLAMTCGLASLHVVEHERLAERAATMGRALVDGLRALIPSYDMLKEVRGAGLMIGIQFGKPEKLAGRASWHAIHAADGSLFPQAFVIPLLDDHHVLTQVAGHHADVIKLLPPLVLSDEDVRWFLAAFEDVLQRAHHFPGPVWEIARKLVKFAVTSGR